MIQFPPLRQKERKGEKLKVLNPDIPWRFAAELLIGSRGVCLDLAPEPGAEAVLLNFQVIPGLKIHPIAIGQAEIEGKPQGGVGCDGSLAMNDLVDPARWDGQALGQAVLRYPHRLEKFLEQNLAGMNGLEFSWHVYSPVQW